MYLTIFRVDIWANVKPTLISKVKNINPFPEPRILQTIAIAFWDHHDIHITMFRVNIRAYFDI